MNTTRGATAFSCMMRAASTIAIASFFVVPSYAQGTANLAQEDQAQDAGSGGSQIQERRQL